MGTGGRCHQCDKHIYHAGDMSVMCQCTCSTCRPEKHIITHTHTHTLIYRRNPWGPCTGTGRWRWTGKQNAIHVSSVFSIDIHRNSINRASLGSVLGFKSNHMESCIFAIAGQYTDWVSGPYQALILEFLQYIRWWLSWPVSGQPLNISIHYCVYQCMEIFSDMYQTREEREALLRPRSAMW